MSTSFADFADAMARPQRAVPTASRALERIAVLGGGADARLIAAIALSEGIAVTLFSAYGSELSGMQGGIALRGDGPVGSYQVNADAVPSVQTTAELDAAVVGADAIFLTGPIHKQRTYAMVLADHLADGQVLVLANARTFGALESRWLLQIGGCMANVAIVEAQGLPFWMGESGTTLNLSVASDTSAAVCANGDTATLDALRPILSNIQTSSSIAHSSFADGSGLIEAPALLLGGPALGNGRPAVPMGGTPLEENNTFRNLLGAEHLAVIGQMAEERREVARRFGVRDLPDMAGWLDRHAGAATGSGARPVPGRDEAQKLVRDAVIGSLVPLTSAAALAGVATPATDAMIGLGSAMLGADLATAGRKLPAMGVTGGDIDTARRQLMSMAGLG